MNNYSCVGRIVRDVELKDGKSVFLMNAVAIDGKDTLFLNFIAFGKQAEVIEKYLKKGEKIGLTGRLEPNEYTTRDNVKVTDIRLNVSTVELLGGSNGEKKDTNDGGGRSQTSGRRSNRTSGQGSAPRGSSSSGGTSGGNSGRGGSASPRGRR